MLGDLPDYSIEPDWMLQSSQISDSALVCELVGEYYPGLNRLALCLLGNVEKARQASGETIYWAVANRHRYWGEPALRIWLYAHVYHICQRAKKSVFRIPSMKNSSTIVDDLLFKPALGTREYLLAEAFLRLSETQRALLILENLEDFTPEQIAQVLGGKSRLNWVQQHLHHIHSDLMSLTDDIALPELEIIARIKQLLRTWLPYRDFNLEEEAALCAEIETQIAAGWGRKKIAIGGKELAIGGLVVALVIGLGMAADLMGIPAEPSLLVPDQQATMAAYNGVFATPPSSAFGVFFLSTDFPHSEMFTPTPISPRPSEQPLTGQSSIQEIKYRMEQSDYFWSTLFADALIVDYGPKGYVGPPQLYRNRLWFSQPAHMMVLAGRPNQSPDYARIVIDNNYFEEDMVSGVAYYPKSVDLVNSQRASSVILSYALNFANRNKLFGYYLTDLLFPYNAISNASQIQLVGQDSFNGRVVLVLRWVRADQKEQVWVDAITGLVLGWRSFETINSEVPVRDIFITSLALDVNFPGRLYSYRPQISDKASWADVWTPDLYVIHLRTEDDILRSAIGRAPLPVVRAPIGLDPSNSTLTFQWNTLPDGSLSPDVSILSGNYYVGTVNMGDPWSLLCTRSPDGSTIAFIKHPDIPIYAPETIQWFRLRDTANVFELFPNGYTASDVAFSPDSQKLAFFGCSNNESNCGIFLLNLQTQQRQELLKIGTGAYFAWSPDGQNLALLGSDDLGSLRVFVINVNTGEVIYTGPIDWKTFTTALDSPTRTWGVPFPSYLGGLEACVSRPIP
jgi:DNA-directed RNA polymerase specialized sigma24 family protein/WD40 repeat protein